MPGPNPENDDRPPQSAAQIGSAPPDGASERQTQRSVDLPAVDLRRLRYFAAVAEELSFSQAADRLGLSQQALSSQIRRLEDQVGRSLFFRTTRRVELTAAGRALLPKAQLSLRAAQEALDTARAAEPERRYKPWL
jgi:DNA-binding MarR family transcriptional regulator